MRVGTLPGASDVLVSHADGVTGFRRVAAPGNAGSRNHLQLQLPPGKYYATVQAVDSAFTGGAFSTELAFATLPELSIRRQGDQLVVAWTAPDSGYVLESSEVLSVPNWQPEPMGTISPVLISAAQTSRFFRLRKP